uniref:Transglutaminase-like domain-containing protein n=1 Tax=Phytophthora ramorum TaxID=164328 RepID=H3G591_PHYRM
YENKQMQAEALRRIPVDKLHERAQANPSPMPLYQDELVKQLLHWFKREFFTWMNQPRCSTCNHEKTRSVRNEGPSTPEEITGHASRVEVYQCPVCSAFTRFPRYNDPVKLLDTRTGRCGEWANCFTLCCRAMGFEARYVLDVTDHVWTEVYSDHFKRWLHCDSCEDQLDCPLTYEVGWGKKLSYIFSFAHDEVVDTARRYTQNWAEMRSRRQEVSEKWLESTINQINCGLWERYTPERVAVLRERARNESEELLRGRAAQTTEVKGRVSGSAEWKNQRNEEGK